MNNLEHVTSILEGAIRPCLPDKDVTAMIRRGLLALASHGTLDLEKPTQLTSLIEAYRALTENAYLVTVARRTTDAPDSATIARAITVQLSHTGWLRDPCAKLTRCGAAAQGCSLPAHMAVAYATTDDQWLGYFCEHHASARSSHSHTAALVTDLWVPASTGYYRPRGCSDAESCASRITRAELLSPIAPDDREWEWRLLHLLFGAFGPRTIFEELALGNPHASPIKEDAAALLELIEALTPGETQSAHNTLRILMNSPVYRGEIASAAHDLTRARTLYGPEAFAFATAVAKDRSSGDTPHH